MGKILNAVKTEERAREILQTEIDNSPYHWNDDDILWEDGEGHCQCGQTQTLKCSDMAGNFMMTVAICECCGDNNNSYNEVINYY